MMNCAKYSLFSLLALAMLFFGATLPAQSDPNARILVMGDSLLASHSISGRAVSDAVEDTLGVRVTDRSVLGARMIYRLPITGAMGLNISKQYKRGNWDWIILNGGGNDLWFGCGCNRCTKKLNKLISTDGKRGEIARLVADLRKTGAQVVYVGYLRSPGVGSPIEHCRDEGNELERRIARLAVLDRGTHFLSLADLVPFGDRSYHGMDMIHPSLKASAEIGRMVAGIIRP